MKARASFSLRSLLLLVTLSATIILPLRRYREHRQQDRDPNCWIQVAVFGQYEARPHIEAALNRSKIPHWSQGSALHGFYVPPHALGRARKVLEQDAAKHNYDVCLTPWVTLYDRNESGALEPSEWGGRLYGDFRRYDTNRDGHITPLEMERILIHSGAPLPRRAKADGSHPAPMS